MNNSPKFTLYFLGASAALGFLIFLVVGSGGRDDPDANQNLGAAEPPLVPEAEAGDLDGHAGDMNDQHVHLVERGIATLAEGLANMGGSVAPGVVDRLRGAIDGEDTGEIRRAFHEATYGRFAVMSESIAAVSEYLDASDPHVRYLASEALLRMGDDSGVDVLIDLISSRSPILENGIDLRIESARLLGRYGSREAVAAMESLYEATGNGVVLNALARLQAGRPSEWLVSKIKDRSSPGFVAFNLGLVGLPRGENVVQKAFKEPRVPAVETEETKIIAAWALAKNVEDPAALEFLKEAASAAIDREDPNTLAHDNGSKALKYLGSIQSSEAVIFLENALDSTNPVVVRYAIVNLLFNQPARSEKAEKFVLRELQSTPEMLGIELAMQIASKIDDDQIRAVAESYDLRTGGDRWRYWGVERSDWPLQSWIYDYVVVLNP